MAEPEAWPAVSANDDLPKGWTWTRLGDVALFENGDRSSNYPSMRDRVADGVPFINTGHIQPNGRLTDDAMDFITRASFEKLRAGRVQRGDILYCLRGSTIGKTALNHYAEGSIASSLVIVRAKGNALQEYLFYFLSGPLGQRLVKQHDNGSAQPNLSVGAISQYPVPLPPIAQQRAIASTLMSLDDKIELNRRMNVTLEAMARAIFRDWFVDFGPTHAKMEGRSPYLAPDFWSLFPDTINDATGLPEGWADGALDDLCDLNPEAWSAARHPASVAYVDLSNTKWGNIESVEHFAWAEAPSRARRVLRPGDTIVGTVRPGNGSYAFVSEDDLTGSTGFAVLRAHQQFDQTFVWCASTSSENIERLAHLADGGAYPAVRPGVVAASPTVVAGDDVRAGFDHVCRPLLERMERNKAENAVLGETRDFLLPKLMSGEIRVGDVLSEVGQVT